MARPLTAVEPGVPLIDSARRGDPEALATLYREHAGGLLRTLSALLRDPAEAEDVLHDLFVGLPEALQRYTEHGALRSWLGAIAVRLALMRLRTRRRRHEVTLDHTITSRRDGDDQRLADRIAVHDALRKLPERLRVVIVLREIEGWSYRQISAQTGVSEGALMARHSRAMKRLRHALKDPS